METLIINVPETKLPLVKLLMKELGITIQSKTNENAKEVSIKKPSDFFGILGKEEGKKLDKHINQIREE